MFLDPDIHIKPELIDDVVKVDTVLRLPAEDSGLSHSIVRLANVHIGKKTFSSENTNADHCVKRQLDY